MEVSPEDVDPREAEISEVLPTSTVEEEQDRPGGVAVGLYVPRALRVKRC